MTPHKLRSVLLDTRLLGLSCAEWTAFGLYLLFLALVVPHHEPWADEAQAWLIARDLPLPGIFHQAGYEGTPALWFCLLKVLCWLHTPYLGMRWLSAASAATGVFLFLRYSRFPLPLKLLLPFTFWIQYQYAVVSRNYVLFVPLLFAVAALYRERWRRFILLSLAMAALAQVSTHALLFSGSLAVVLAWELWQKGAAKLVSIRRLRLGALIIAAALAFAYWTARPPHDVTSTALSGNRFAHYPMLVRTAIYALRGFRAFSFSFSLWPVLSGIALVSLIVTLYLCRRLALLLPFLGIWMLEGFVWQGWHAGLLFVSFVGIVWMALADLPPTGLTPPVARATPNADKPEVPGTPAQGWKRAFGLFGPMRNALLTVLFAGAVLQLPWTWFAMTSDRSETYCPSQRVAAFLQQQAGKRIYGFRYQSVAILPYFERNIFANQNMAHAYWHWGIDNHNDDPSTISSAPPDIAVIGWSRASGVEPRDVPLSEVQKALLANGYAITREFCGSMFMRNEVSLRPCFELYERKQ